MFGPKIKVLVNTFKQSIFSFRVCLHQAYDFTLKCTQYNIKNKHQDVCYKLYLLDEVVQHIAVLQFQRKLIEYKSERVFPNKF